VLKEQGVIERRRHEGGAIVKYNHSTSFKLNTTCTNQRWKKQATATKTCTYVYTVKNNTTKIQLQHATYLSDTCRVLVIFQFKNAQSVRVDILRNRKLHDKTSTPQHRSGCFYHHIVKPRCDFDL